MVLKMKEIIAFENIMAELTDLKLPPKVAYKISKIIKKVDVELKTFYEMRMRIVQEYAEKDENGQLVLVGNDAAKIREDGMTDCNRELEELLDVSIQFDDGLRMSIDSFGDKDISLVLLHVLDPFLSD